VPTIKMQREKIAKANSIVKMLDDGGKTVKYLDLSDKFTQQDGMISADVMHNFVHLTEKGYRIWADGIKGPIKELMEAK
jgi:N-acetylglucosamine-6-sulfatase